MPALITHHLFGEESAKLLPDGLVSSEEELLAFLLGNQGPDPFFFRVLGAPSGVKGALQLGHRMHNERMTRAFQALRESVGRLPEHDRGIGRAFALGMLSHYALDRVAHPFVYAQQYELVEKGKGLEDAGSAVHALIETDIDVWMLEHKRGLSVAECAPADELARTKRIERVAGAMTSAVAWQAFGIDLPATEYAGAIKNMEMVYRTIEPAGSVGACAIGRIERLVKPHSQVQALAHPTRVPTPCASANEGRHEWTSPFGGNRSNEDFAQVFDRALSVWIPLAQAFTYGGCGLEDAVGHLNYSGRKLDQDEHCDFED